MDDKEEINPENYGNWFALYKLCQLTKQNTSVLISSIDFGKLLGLSQQTGSRRINELIELGWIKREKEGKSQRISITKQGANVMLSIYKKLKEILESIVVIGEVCEGMHEGAYYVSIKGYFDQFNDKLGFEPYKGTLNLKLSETAISILREKLNNIGPVIIDGFKDQNREYGPVRCYDVVIARLDDMKKQRKAAILDITRTHHDENIIEILAKPYLRDYFNLKNGDKLIIEVIKNSGFN
ncbi:MAG: CTP-dependent riboflavin kinase [Promethearchaeota archaeon]|nr:MAG: CTP-dependent riboflavin kinase [Candidatus Lokiarchaeota archaeon]